VGVIAAASGVVFVGAGLTQPRPFTGSRPGEEREVDGVRLCWCPPGQFITDSPAGEKHHRPDEADAEPERP